VAVQSHWFGVGTIVPWLEPGIGAVATQSIAEPSYGPKGLALMRAGIEASEALGRLTADDDGAAVRQVAMVDAGGRAVVHTGASCVREAGHHVGDGFSCQANMMLNDTVPDAMAQAFESARGSLDERLLAALDAGEAAGGDVRGRQSAAMIVVPGEAEPWGRVFDLRVDDHKDPLGELRRLHALQRAYNLSEEAEALVAEGRHEDATALFQRAAALAPDNDELLFWSGLAAAQGGDLATALDRVRVAAGLNPRWLVLLERLEPEVAPAAAELRAALHKT
jgi:uncharacterized Ntn-hydrolase superfamily protein